LGLLDGSGFEIVALEALHAPRKKVPGIAMVHYMLHYPCVDLHVRIVDYRERTRNCRFWGHNCRKKSV